MCTHRIALRPLLLATLVALLPACRTPVEDVSTEQMFAAARAGDVDEVRRLVGAGVPVGSEDRYGSTALLMAAGAGHAGVVRYLLDRGADPNHQESFYGADALGMALFGDHLDVAAVVVEGGADDRELALEVALQRGSLDLARVAVAAGPIYQSRLDGMRARADDLDPELRALLESAEVRPDPAPPTLSAEELTRFAGRFEGQTSDTLVDVSPGPGRLAVSIDGGDPVALAIVAEDTFRSEDGRVEASFFGRAGTIEGLSLRRGDAPPVSLRHSVAEPAGPAAFRPEDGSLTAGDGEPTVHWPAFRGRNASGVGDGVDVPVQWDMESGRAILWETKIPGLGNSSPVVWGDRVFVTTAVAEGIPQEVRTGLTGDGSGVDEAVEHRWMVLALHKRTGELLWETEIGRAVPLTRRHFKASQANSTPATDGRHLVVVFPTAGMACLDLDGTILWKHNLGGLNAGAFTDPAIEWGFASSPILHGSLAILQVDIHEGPYLAAWDLESGDQVWRVERDVAPSWATPAVVAGDAGDELIVNGSTIHAYDPESGTDLWSLGPNSELVIPTPVAGRDVVYVSAGYPPVKPIYAVRAGTRGSMEVDPAAGHESLLWSHSRGGAYMPTPLLYRGLYYVVHHNGRVVAYDADSGTAVYKSRFSHGGVFTASPVAVNGKIYLPTEEGMIYVLEAGPEYRELAVNEMREPLMATPAVSEGILLVRTPTRLVAIANRSREGAAR